MDIPPVVKSQQKNERTDKIPMVFVVHTNNLLIQFYVFLIAIAIFFSVFNYKLWAQEEEKTHSRFMYLLGQMAMCD